ncbi:hypothetical protein EV182_001296 [Spiromyces aspiralis]|uniref:Uncharacterized protein n=1 Tax=Spiromyces aspiralis TaxID=68401 RepID=A0ACC1HGU9_9FUNG|nr:hypothetical protein EV182_001296 [Spiromyces aspiralis]
MASGYGYQGKYNTLLSFRISRFSCLAIYLAFAAFEFKKCYILSEDSTKSDCAPHRDDYLECIHNIKEIARVKKIKEVEAQKLKSGELKPLGEVKVDPRLMTSPPT